MFLSSGADVNAADNRGATPLVHAALKGDDLAVAVLLEKVRRVSDAVYSLE